MKVLFGKFLLFIVMVMLSANPAFASVLKGRVLDNNGQPLPFATVYIKGTTMGTTANADALYQLDVAAGTYTVLCQYMGYKQTEYTLTIADKEVKMHNFKLESQQLSMNAVVVRSGAEDPAYAIIRKAIKKRKFHLSQTESFQSSIYLKGVLRNRKTPNQIMGISVVDEDGTNEVSSELGLDSNGKGVLYLCEEEADYYVKGNKRKTIIKSVKESGDKNGLGMSQVPPVINFYENNVIVLNGVSRRGFISPISDNAISYYKYKYEGTYVENGYAIDKITVTPKRLYEPLFSGTIYIVEDDWAIHSLEMQATNKANLEMLDTIIVKQVYLPIGKDKWIIKDQVIYPTITFFGFDISGHFISIYDKQQMNPDIPDSIFKDKVVSAYLPDANKRDSNYWDDKRPIALQGDEVKDYKVKDSIMQVRNDPARIDSLRKRGNRFSPTGFIMGGIGYSTKEYKHRFNTNSLMSGLVNYNTIEGLSLAPRISWRYRIDTGRVLSALVAPRYGFSNKHFNLFGKLSYRQDDNSWRGKYWQVGVSGGKYVFQYNQQTNVNSFNNTISTLFYSKNYMKLYERWTASAYYNQDFGNGLLWSLKAGFQKRLPLNNTSYYTFVNDGNRKWTSNYPKQFRHVKWEEHNAVLLKADVSYTPGMKYVQYPDKKVAIGSNKPTFTVTYEKGLVGILDSKVDFDKWRVSVQDNMDFKLLGSLFYNIAAGGFFNSNYVSIPDMKHFTDNQLALAAPYGQSFQIAPFYKYSNTETLYGEAHFEYNLNGLLTNKVPFFRRTQWYLILGNNTFYGASDGRYYTEAFIALDNIGYKVFRGLRIDLIRSWDSEQNVHTGLRFGFNLDGLITVGNTYDRFDW